MIHRVLSDIKCFSKVRVLWVENTISKFLRAWPDRHKQTQYVSGKKLDIKVGKRLTMDMKHRTPKVQPVVFSTLMLPGRFANINKQKGTDRVLPFQHLAVLIMRYIPVNKAHVPYICFPHFGLIIEAKPKRCCLPVLLF